MKIPVILTFLIVFAFVTILSEGRQERELHITSLSIQFNKTDATFTVYYDFDTFSKTYLLLFGAATLEPRIRSVFPNFEYEIIKLDTGKAVLKVNDISRLNKGYYLHNSQKFGETIDIVYISDPSTTKIREYFNINSTPDYFYHS